jgi:hypothetical protein
MPGSGRGPCLAKPQTTRHATRQQPSQTGTRKRWECVVGLTPAGSAVASHVRSFVTNLGIGLRVGTVASRRQMPSAAVLSSRSLRISFVRLGGRGGMVPGTSEETKV